MQLVDAEAAARQLGIITLDGLTLDTVNEAFRNAVRNAHPDGRGDTVENDIFGPAYLIERAKNARNLLIAWLRDMPNPRCPMCSGVGWIANGGFGVKPCSRCA